MSTLPAAFLLLTLRNATLNTPTTSSSGHLSLESVTLTEDAKAPNTPNDTYLVLRLDALELPIDPTCPIILTISRGVRAYTFRTPDPEAGSSATTLAVEDDPRHAEEIETLDTILAQYADFTWETGEDHADAPEPAAAGDMRGRLVLMDEENGEIVSEVGHRAPITEDPALAQQDEKQAAGPSDEKAGPVVLELPPDVYDAYTSTSTGTDLLEARELFVRAVPPEEQDWIMKSAMLFSRAVDSSTSLVLGGITAASTYCIDHSTPAPYASGSNATAPSSSGSTPAPAPSRALQALTSPQAHAALARAHTFSRQAMRVSQRTVELVEGMIRRAVGGQPKPTTTQQRTAGAGGNEEPSTAPPYAPPYAPRAREPDLGDKPERRPPPPLPPRSPLPSASSSSRPPLPPTGSAGGDDGPGQQLHRGARLALSANLVLAALDDSVRRVWDGSSASLDAVVQHKYGPAAARSTHLASNTARNVVLVYIDMRGFARRALVKKAGTQWLRGQAGKAGKSPQDGGTSKADDQTQGL